MEDYLLKLAAQAEWDDQVRSMFRDEGEVSDSDSLHRLMKDLSKQEAPGPTEEPAATGGTWGDAWARSSTAKGFLRELIKSAG